MVVPAALVMRMRAPLGGILIGFAFVGVLTIALASLSYSLALKVSKPHEFGPVVNAVSMPSMLLSGLMLPMALAPGRLDALSRFMPFRYLVDAMRAAYVGDYASTTMLYGALMSAALVLVSVTVGTRVFREAGA